MNLPYSRLNDGAIKHTIAIAATMAATVMPNLEYTSNVTSRAQQPANKAKPIHAFCCARLGVLLCN